MNRRLVAFCLLALAVCSPAAAEPISSEQIRVIDGDTLAIGGRTIDLTGLNAPEINDAQCAAERELGERAKAELQSVARMSALDFEPVPCPCPAGTNKCGEDTCGILRADRLNIAELLIRNGLAVPFECGAANCPKPLQPWCATP